MPSSFTAGVRDSLSNLAASLGAGKDKAAYDSFVLFDLDRGQIESMYRGDWLARKVVDIVPYDMVRAWREWSGHREDVVRVEAAERRLGLRKALQRALTLGRLYGGGAIVIGTGETDPAALARPLDPDTLPRGGLKFLHAVSRWQLAAPAVDRDPLSPWFGEALAYDVVAPERGSLRLHPSRVVRFLGNAWPDPSLGASVWSDSALLALYDAIHAVALTMAGATSLMHEAKVDVVTVPNLSEHLSSADTTAQLSARFAYAAAMKSINNLLLLGDGETWARQKIDFAGLPEMVRTFLQVAAGAADIPVTRLLGQSPAGLSATGDSDTRNYYDMISARQEIDLRPQLERLDRLIARSEGIDPGALTFAFRPLWQMDTSAKAALALSKAQATAVYAGLGLWPAAVTAQLVEAQLVQDGVYPNAAATFAEASATAAATGPVAAHAAFDFDPAQPRDPQGQWTAGRAESMVASALGAIPTLRRAGLDPPRSPSAAGGILGVLSALNPIGTAAAQEVDPEEENRGLAGEPADPMAEIRITRYNDARRSLQEIDPKNPALETMAPPDYVPSEQDIHRVEDAAEAASIRRVCDFAFPNGEPVGQPGGGPDVRVMPGGGLSAAQQAFDLYPGDYTLESLAREGFQFWPGTMDELVTRIDAEWVAFGKTPDLEHCICWFALRPPEKV